MTVEQSKQPTKNLKGLTGRCLLALASGVAIVSLIALQLTFISGAEEAEDSASAQQNRYVISFPQDEESLRELSQQMMREAAEKAARIETAAGAEQPE